MGRSNAAIADRDDEVSETNRRRCERVEALEYRSE
jgi:hypothetical protein